MISNRTRQKWQNRFGLIGLGGVILVLRMFFVPGVPAWVPGLLLVLLGVGTLMGYAIFPRSISRWDRYHTSDIGISVERVWFAVACGVGIWVILSAGVVAVLIAAGIIFAPVPPQASHQGIQATDMSQRP